MNLLSWIASVRIAVVACAFVFTLRSLYYAVAMFAGLPS